MKGESVVFSRGKDNWSTPQDLFDRYHTRYQFTLDVAADTTNHLLPRWLGPGSSIAPDALSVSWSGETCWMNPPYSNIKDFVAKAAYEQQQHGVTSVLLIPSRTDTRWWHDFIWDAEARIPYWRRRTRGEFLRGRVKFVDPTSDNTRPNNSAPFPSVVVIFTGYDYEIELDTPAAPMLELE